MTELRNMAEKLDMAIIKSRLNSLGAMLVTDRADRLNRIAAVLDKLRPGAYLVGTGPSTVGIIPLTVDEVVLGRWATPLETPADTIVDHQVGDTVYLGPYEVSRVHAKVVREQLGAEHEFRICDLGSRCGTFVNGEKVDSDGVGRVLCPGDVISLGSSHISTYLFLVIE